MKHLAKIQAEFAKRALDFKKKTISKDDDPFTYKNIADDMWWDLFSEAKDHFKIWFDLENNDPVKGQKRTITISEKQDDGWTNDFKFNCELWRAGGDWEFPTLYFRCQITDGSFYPDESGEKIEELPYPGSVGSFKSSHFIMMPPKEAGNPHLIKEKSSKGEDYWGSPNNGDIDSKHVPETDDKAAWKWLEEFLFNHVKKYLESRRKKPEA